MTGPAQPRHRCTLLIVDLVESVRLLLVDEAGVIARWQRFIQDARHGPDSPVARAGGRVVKSLGDGLLVEVADVHGALPCAADLHGLIAALNVGVAPELQFRLRIGVHIAEVVRDELDLFGHGVNLAARLASLAGPGETVVSVACRDELASDDRLTLIDLGDCYLKHLPEPVRAFRVGPASPPGVSLDAPLAEGLGLALLPLQPLTEDPLGFGGALDYELQATLCGAQSLRVVSRLSVLPLLGLALEPAALGRRLRVDYLVSGAWRALGTQVEVHLEVTHAASGRLAGSAHGRVSRNSPCAADAGLRALAEAVLRTVFDAELTRHAPAALPNVASYALLHRGIGLMHRMSPAAAQSAESALEHLAERHPRAATPKAWLARWHLVRIAQAWAPDVGEAARRARDLVRQAIDADPSNALALALDGLLDSFVERRLDGAEQRYRQALHVDPNEPLAWMFLSALLAHRARGAESLQAMLRAEQLLPVDPTGFYRDGYGAWARLAAGEPSAAMQLARRSLQANRHHLPTYVTLAAAEALAGEHDAARVTAAALLLRRPGFSVQRYVDAFPGGINDHARRIGDALAAAGVPR